MNDDVKPGTDADELADEHALPDELIGDVLGGGLGNGGSTEPASDG